MNMPTFLEGEQLEQAWEKLALTQGWKIGIGSIGPYIKNYMYMSTSERGSGFKNCETRKYIFV